ncbi:hypothetical protein MKZ38_001914 [Zalerion maritima]|uniref:Uncharacterized protein n=1 Tax=Zalerion maritima TaxID=339359 RepID=A0AAD5RQW5_9PEZI|nr:hypothetical protein MKZ38_001914 [Zalerion maritima]
MADVQVTTDVKIVAIVLGLAVLLAVTTVVIVAFFWRPPKRRRLTPDGDSETDTDLETAQVRPSSLAVESREIEEVVVARDGSNQEPRNMVPNYQ